MPGTFYVMVVALLIFTSSRVFLSFDQLQRHACCTRPQSIDTSNRLLGRLLPSVLCGNNCTVANNPYIMVMRSDPERVN